MKWRGLSRTCLSLAVLVIIALSATLPTLSSQYTRGISSYGAINYPTTTYTIFKDGFSGGLSDWTIESGTWTIENNKLRGTAPDNQRRVILYRGEAGNDYEIDVRVYVISAMNFPEGQIAFRYESAGNYYFAGIGAYGYKAAIGTYVGGSAQLLASGGGVGTVGTGTWYDIRVKAVGPNLAVYVDGKEICSVVDTVHGTGKVGLTVYSSSVYFDDFEIRTQSPPSPSPPAQPPVASQIFFGTGEDYLLQWGGTWSELIPKLKYWKFNTVRLLFSSPTYTGSKLQSVFNYASMNNVLNQLYANGVQGILDLHNQEDHLGYFGSPAWKTFWTDLAQYYKDDPRVAAFEIFNEPNKGTFYNPYWGQYDFTRILAETIDAIHAIDPDRVVVYPPLQFWYFNGWVSSWAEVAVPSEHIRPHVVYNIHAWMESNTDVNLATSWAQGTVNAVVSWRNNKMGGNVPVWLGEFGFYTGINNDAQKAYTRTLVNGMVDNGMGFAWFLYYRDNVQCTNGQADYVLSTSRYATSIGL